MLTKWNSGKPPCEGWWNASVCRDPKARRYWNGKWWSAPVYVGDPEKNAKVARQTPARLEGKDVIQWRGLTAPRAAA